MSIVEKYKKISYTWGRCEKCGKWTSYKLDISDNSIMYFQDGLLNSLLIHVIRNIRDIRSLSICNDCMKDIVIPSLSDNKRNRRKNGQKEVKNG